jgi:uncharacterized lipoprotein YajG
MRRLVASVLLGLLGLLLLAGCGGSQLSPVTPNPPQTQQSTPQRGITVGGDGGSFIGIGG